MGGRGAGAPGQPGDPGSAQGPEAGLGLQGDCKTSPVPSPSLTPTALGFSEAWAGHPVG